jgi:hypothetical protein
MVTSLSAPKQLDDLSHAGLTFLDQVKAKFLQSIDS